MIFWLIYSGKLKTGASGGYSIAELIPFFLLMRACPLFMMEERAAGNYIAFGIDMAVMAVICALTSKAGKKASAAATLYMFCPLPVLCIAIGSGTAIAANAAVSIAAAVFVFLTLRKYVIASPAVFFPGYAVISAGIYALMYSSVCQGHSISELRSSNQFAAFTVIGFLCIIAGIVMIIAGRISLGKGNSAPEAKKVSKESAKYEHEKFGKKNIIHIAVLTVLYAAAVLFQLGSHEAPETGIKFNADDSGNAEYIIDLGDYLTVSKLEVFLGQESKRSVSISTYNEVKREWISIKTEEMKTAFAWNTIDIGWNVKYIGIVFSAADTHVNEIVILDNDGNILTPINTSDRPELFDEQSKYPETATYYYRMMFDEIYHGRTAYEFLHDLSIYENTHPPLGKTLISLGIQAFGMNPFGWRIVCAVFGTLLVPMIYIFAWKISKRSDIALTGGFLIATEFMHFTLSRIATIDVIVAQFIIMMFFFMFCFTEELINNGKFSKQALWLLLSGISAGLAIATKWTGLYGAAGIAVIFFTFLIKHCAASGKFKDSVPYLSKLCAVCVVSFIIIPLACYSLSYIQFAESYPDKNIIQHAIENSKSMLSYHSEVTASHPYESPWYDWLIDKQPLLDAFDTVNDEQISSIATFGNPLILFAGLAALVYNIYLWRCKKNAAAQFLSIAYLSMLMPWFFIHRTVFIYQYFGCVLIMILLICNALLNLCRKPKRTEAVIIILSVLLFIMFFPEISGMTVSRKYTNQMLEWFPTWIFE